MNHVLFSDAFAFVEFHFGKYRYTDNRQGALYHYLATLEEGRCRIETERESLEIASGEAFYIPMGLRYQSFWYGDDGIRFRSYGFQYFPGETGYRLQKLSPPAFDTVREIPLRDSPDAEALGRMYAVLAACIPGMIREDVPMKDRLVRRATEYMSRNTGAQIPEIAGHCGVGESTLYAAFRAVEGKTPNEIRQGLLVQKAVRMLSTGSLSVQQISERLGFSSDDYFRRILKKHTGMTPREIRTRSGIL